MSTVTNSSHRRDAMAEESLVAEENKKKLMTDAAYAIKLCRKFFTALGVWPRIDPGIFSCHNVLGNISVMCCYYCMGIRTIPVGLYLILDEKVASERLMLVGRLAFVFIAGTKYTLLRYHRENIDECVKHIELDWLKLESATSRDIMLEHAQFGHVLTTICAVFICASATLTVIIPLAAKRFADVSAHNGNITDAMGVRNFAISSHFGHVVFNETPIYEVIYTSQVIASFVLYSISVACYSLTVVIVMHACGQLKILMEKLNELVDGGGKMTMYDSVDGRMSDILRHHASALRFVSSAEKMLRGMCLVDLGGYTFELCCLGYTILLEFRAEIKQPVAICAWSMVFITFTFNVFSLCYIGELLTQESIKVGEVTYMIEWHRLPGKQPLALVLMIAMAQSHVTLTAGGAIQLSMSCFASVMKTSLGYLNMLRAVMD